MKYPINDNGGWIVPGCEVFGDYVVVPPFSTFGDGVKFGCATEFGNYAKFGCATEFGNYAEFGNMAKFGSDAVFGDLARFGDASEFGNRAKFGCGMKIAGRFMIEGIEAIKIMSLANIDGSGRKLTIIIGSDFTAYIRAGCFFGTVEEFSEKAESENKLIYANAVTAFVKAVIKQIKKGGAE